MIILKTKKTKDEALLLFNANEFTMLLQITHLLHQLNDKKRSVSKTAEKIYSVRIRSMTCGNKGVFSDHGESDATAFSHYKEFCAATG
jgi:hypothetical protein